MAATRSEESPPPAGGSGPAGAAGTAPTGPGGGTMAALARGAGMNSLGILAKVLYPLLFVAITRLYGPATAGVFILASTILDVVVNLSISGFNDGVLLFLSRHGHDPREERRAYGVLANAVAAVGALALAGIVLSRVGGPALLRVHYPQEGLAEAVRGMALALPFLGLATIAIAATKARLVMRHDAIVMGFVRPAALLAGAAGLASASPGLPGLVAAYVAAQAVTAAAALWAFSRHYSLAKVGAALASFRPFPPLLSFALPQSLSMTFTHLASGIGVLALGYYGTRPELIAFFATGAEIVRNVRQVRLAFSTALAPLVGRLHAAERLAELEHAYGVVTRWVLLLAVPALLLVVLLRADLLRIFHRSYAAYDTSFMLLLAAGPLLNAVCGNATTLIVMSGRSALNLANTFAAALVNVAACAALVPRLGIVGAAAGTALATAAVSLLGVVQARALLGLRLPARLVYKPLAAGLAALPLLLLPAALGDADTLALRLVLAAATVAAYLGALRLLGFEAEDRPLLNPFLERAPKAPAPPA